VSALHVRCEGGYAAIAMIANVGLVAFRDPNGIRPLVVGVKSQGEHKSYMVAS